jgi:hypothetical protein
MFIFFERGKLQSFVYLWSIYSSFLWLQYYYCLIISSYFIFDLLQYDVSYNIFIVKLCYYSGAIMIGSGNRDIQLIKTTLYNNTAGWDGGGLKMVSRNQNISFIECVISHNVAHQDDGGGVYIREKNSDVLFLNSNLEYNRVDIDKGGGLYMWQYNFNISIIGTNFR